MKELDKTKVYDVRDLSDHRKRNLSKTLNIPLTEDFVSTAEYVRYFDFRWSYGRFNGAANIKTFDINALTLFDTETNIINKQKTDKILPRMTEEKTTDKIVLSVMNDLNERSKVGINKYGVTLEREDLDIKDWINHAYEEALDKANYLKVLKNKFDHLNSYELELIDLIINCRKSGTFSEDLTKAKKKIKKYLINYNSDK